jgi:Pyruvate/2-oxoacid:ferredoxin oxidoreductase delta subunit
VTKRKLIQIDEEKCDRCGLCVPACAEGAIQIIDGKAKLVSETYCDGLGACLGKCPQDAITIEEREAVPFDPAEVEKHLKNNKNKAINKTMPSPVNVIGISHGCPGSRAMSINQVSPSVRQASSNDEKDMPSHLRNWPVQLHLAPLNAPYFNNANLLIAADCVPFAFADFHRRFLDGRVLLIACPKLDNMEAYHNKLLEIFQRNEIRNIEVCYMEVPCCLGLVHLVQGAIADSGKEIPLKLNKLSIGGEMIEEREIIKERNIQ